MPWAPGRTKVEAASCARERTTRSAAWSAQGRVGFRPARLVGQTSSQASCSIMHSGARRHSAHERPPPLRRPCGRWVVCRRDLLSHGTGACRLLRARHRTSSVIATRMASDQEPAGVLGGQGRMPSTTTCTVEFPAGMPIDREIRSANSDAERTSGCFCGSANLRLHGRTMAWILVATSTTSKRHFPLKESSSTTLLARESSMSCPAEHPFSNPSPRAAGDVNMLPRCCSGSLRLRVHHLPY